MKYQIGIVSTGIPFNDNSISTGSLGGSETGIIYLSREFAKKGHEVFVFSSCGPQAEGLFDGVRYFDLSRWKHLGTQMDLDVLIVNRASQYLTDPCRAKSIYYYCQDATPSDDMVHEQLWQTDRIALLSPFHKKIWNDIEPRYAPHILEVRNGVDLELVNKARKSVRKRSAVRDDKVNFIYASRPERGLNYLLDMWPKILKETPNAFLTITSYDSSSIAIPENVQNIMNLCWHKASQFPDSIQVIPKGLKKFELYRLFLGCRALLYPCAFPEISCISALEAMATDTLVIATNDFAFPDTVGAENGILIDGKPNEEKYQKDFIDSVTLCSRNDILYKNLVTKALARITDFYSWESAAQLWLTDFEQLFARRVSQDSKGIAQALYLSEGFIASPERCRTSGFPMKHKEITGAVIESHSVSPSVDTPSHHFPGNTSKGLAIRSILTSYLARYPKATTLLELSGGVGDLSAYICKSHGQLEVDSLIPDNTRRADAVEYYRNSTDSPLSASEKANLHFYLKPHRSEFDIVLAEKFVDYSADLPASIAEVESHVIKGGLCILITREGSWSAEERQKDSNYLSGRVHNFDGEDLRQLLGHKKNFESQCIPHIVNNRGEALRHWITFWEKTGNVTVGPIDLSRKTTVTRPYQRLSLCMIVRDNEDTISQCIKSVLSVVDEFVIVDTGSTDSTTEVIKRLIPPERLFLHEFPWTEDFSEARNFALSKCTGDWILWLDSDEYLTNQKFLRKYLNSQISPGFVIRQHHLTMDTELKPDTPVRLFKRGDIKWYGVIHEQVEQAMDASVRPAITIPDINIVHTGYAVEEVRRKKCFDRNMAMMYKDRKQNPDRRLGKMLLAREYRNIINYRLEESLNTGGGVSQDSILLMREICAGHHNDFLDFTDPLHKNSFSVYQETLRMMVKLGIPIKEGIAGLGIKTVQFPYKDNGGTSRIKSVHFLTENEYNDYCLRILSVSNSEV